MHSGFTIVLRILIVILLALLAFAAGVIAVTHFGGFSEFSQSIIAPSIEIKGEQGVYPLSYGEQPILSEPDFFAEARESFLREKVTFIEANLSTMEITYYDQGVSVWNAKILTKGKEGSWWETPAGLYKIETKEENHFSTFGNVYSPWSMVFQGNFFIHGWPYYPDGEPVASQFSGGCIRLSNEDAKALYDLIKVGMPVLVFESDFNSDGYTYTETPIGVTADAYLAADLGSMTVLSGERTEEVFPIASITKLMTALVSAEYINLDKDIYIDASMLASTSIPRLSAGTSESAYGLLFPLLLESSNEAAEAFAGKVGRNWFISLMNKKAEALGMYDTHFVDPSGSGAGNVSTPKDLLRLLQYLKNNRSFILKISSGAEVTSAYDTVTHQGLQNFNNPTHTKGFLGGKVGHTTAAKDTEVSLFTVRIGGAERIIALVLLGSTDHNTDIEKLKAHLLERYNINI